MRNFARYSINGFGTHYGIVDSDRPGEAANFGDSFEWISPHMLNNNNLYWSTGATDVVLLDSEGTELVPNMAALDVTSELVPSMAEYAPVDRDYSGGARYGIRRASDGYVIGFRDVESRDIAIAEIRGVGNISRIWMPNDLNNWDVLWPAETAETASTLEEVWAALGAEASNRGWCAEYEEFAAKHGGPARPPRQRTYTVYARVLVRITMDEHPDGSNAAIAAWYANDPYAARAAITEQLTADLGNGVPRVLDLAQSHVVL